MPDRIQRARIVVDRVLLQDDGRLLFERSIAGRSLFARQLLALKKAGVTSVDVVVDREQWQRYADRLERAAHGIMPTVRVVSGASVTPGRALVTSADLIVDPRLLEQAIAASTVTDAAVECVDRFDRPYAAKEKSPYVVGAPGRWAGRLVGPQASDGPPLTPIGLRLEPAVRADGDPVEAPTVRLDVDRYYWHRVRSDRDAREARTKILLGTIKPTDGMYAKANRRVSLAISRWLLDTPVTPNLVTIFTLLCSILAGVVMARGSYPALVAGGFLTWVASMLDGVDGELARAKFLESELGHWLEMACDYGFYLAVVGGYSVGLTRATGDESWMTWGLVGAVGVVLSFFVVAWLKRGYARTAPEGEYYVAFQQAVGAQVSNPIHRFTRLVNVLVTRAAFPYFIVIFNVLGLPELMFMMIVVGTQLSWTLSLYASRVVLRPASRRARAHLPVQRPAADEG